MPLPRSPPGERQQDLGTSSTATSAQPPTSSSIIRISTLRGKRTRQRNAFDNEETKANSYDAETDENRDELLDLVASIESRMVKVSEYDDLIQQHPDYKADVDDEDELDQSFAISERMEACLRRLRRLLTPAAGQPSAARAESRSDEGHVDPSGANSQRTELNVPQLSVAAPPPPVLDTQPEVYSGERTSYRLWRTQFDNWVNRRTTATDADRLVALLKLLRGPPKELIESLGISDANYGVALSLLDDNFGRIDVERNRAMARLSSLPAVRSADDIRGLRQLLNSLQSAVLTLQGLGLELAEYAVMFESRVWASVPERIIFDFQDSCRRDQPVDENGSSSSSSRTSTASSELGGRSAAARIESLIKYLRRYTEHREQVSLIQQSHREIGGSANETPSRFRRPPSDQFQQRNDFKSSSRHPPRQQRMATVASAVPKQPPPRPCFFCRATSHRPSRCNKLELGQRRRILEQLKRCVVCFAGEHRAGDRCRGTKEPCQTCGSREHYTSVHQPAKLPNAPPPTPPPPVGNVSVAAASTLHPPALVMTASANIVSGDRRFPVRIFLDTGSVFTFVMPSVVEKIPGLRKLRKDRLQIKSFKGSHQFDAQAYNICIASNCNDSSRIEISAYAHDFEVDPSCSCPPDVAQAIQRFARDHPLADSSYIDGSVPEPPALLVGVDHFYDIVYNRATRPVTNGVVATASRLGWLVAGRTRQWPQRADAGQGSACCVASVSRSARDMERLWSLEAIGVEEPNDSNFSAEETQALQQFTDGLQYDGQSYTVALPKRASISDLPNNLDAATRRLTSKRKALLRDTAMFERYHSEVMSFVHDGHADEVTDFRHSRPGDADGTYYMPHHQVVTETDGRQKWRIVFDCSAAAPGCTSLNNHLLPGPNLNPDLVKLLLNFRLRPIAISADITRAYLMLNLAESDRPFFRFLWQGPSDDRVRCFQMRKVTWGAAPSGFLLAATLRELFKRVDPSAAYGLGDTLYHDDMLRSFDTEQDAISFIEKAADWFASAGMQLAKWKTNSPAIVTHLKNKGLPSVDACAVEGAILKVLGVAWCPTNDRFRFQLASLAREAGELSRVTKRIVLRFVASVFDPIGWLLPYTVRGKQLIQRLWTHPLRWDEEIVGSDRDDFMKWAAELDNLRELQIPRQVGQGIGPAVAYTLHVFGDASESAYAVAAYLQATHADGRRSTALLMAKSRLAPRDKLTLPRLELMAALLSVRVRVFLLERLTIKIDRVFHYTDSTTTYHWCTSEEPGRWKVFVCNRVSEIQRLSSPQEWFHVPGTQNIADFATRGASTSDLKDNDEWWSGPVWLNASEEDRPCRKLRPVSQDELSPVADECRLVVAPLVQATSEFDLDRIGSLESAIRIVSNVLRFLRRCRRLPPLDDSELRRSAEILLIRWTQRRYFADELAAVEGGDQPSSKSSLTSFTLFIDDDGLLRARTRLTKGPHFSYDEKNPLVLPGHSRLAELLVLHHHRTNAHFGLNTVLSAIRKRFWITRARQIIKGVLHRCLVCRKARGAAANQVQAPLPAERVSLVVPFASTGLDFCGPFYTRSREGTNKSYIALFTCASTRAIHLELVPAMSTPDTHLALRRFLAAHPGCVHIISDNARSFLKAASDVRRLFDSIREPATRELLSQQRIRWEHICPRAPWHGGFYERLVGTVRVALARTLGRSLVSYEELRTIICELAAVVNDRPITYVSADPDSVTPLTPAQFLHGGPVRPALAAITPLDSLGPTGTGLAESTSASQLRRTLLERTNYFKALAARWYREYMLQLRSANMDPQRKPKMIEIGDVCLVKDDNLPRRRWNLARVTDRHVGRDGEIRTYSVRFANGHVSRRAAQILYPLEIV